VDDSRKKKKKNSKYKHRKKDKEDNWPVGGTGGLRKEDAYWGKRKTIGGGKNLGKE